MSFSVLFSIVDQWEFLKALEPSAALVPFCDCSAYECLLFEALAGQTFCMYRGENRASSAQDESDDDRSSISLIIKVNTKVKALSRDQQLLKQAELN